jgi:hypothetical protein
MKYILTFISLNIVVAYSLAQDVVFSFARDSGSIGKTIYGDGLGMEFTNSGIELIYAPFSFALRSSDYQLSHNVLNFRSGHREFHDAMFKFYREVDTMTVILRKEDLYKILPKMYDTAFELTFSSNSTIYVSSQPDSTKLLISPITYNEPCLHPNNYDSITNIFNQYLSTYPIKRWQTNIKRLNQVELKDFSSTCISATLNGYWRYVFKEHYYQPYLINSTLRYSNDTIFEESKSEMQNYIVLNKRDSSGHFIVLESNLFYDTLLLRKKFQRTYVTDDPNVFTILSYWDEKGDLYRIDKYIDRKNGSRYLIEYSNNIFKRKRKRVYRKGGKPLKKHIANKT